MATRRQQANRIARKLHRLAKKDTEIKKRVYYGIMANVKMPNGTKILVNNIENPKVRRKIVSLATADAMKECEIFFPETRKKINFLMQKIYANENNEIPRMLMTANLGNALGEKKRKFNNAFGRQCVKYAQGFLEEKQKISEKN